MAEVFDPAALTEVAVSATLPALNGRRIHGAIDRLVVKADSVLAVDFKSNRAIPDEAEDTPDGILRQMAAYKEALVQIYPDKRVETAILWTETGRLMRLPDALVSSALKAVTVA